MPDKEWALRNGLAWFLFLLEKFVLDKTHSFLVWGLSNEIGRNLTKTETCPWNALNWKVQGQNSNYNDQSGKTKSLPGPKIPICQIEMALHGSILFLLEKFVLGKTHSFPMWGLSNIWFKRFNSFFIQTRFQI